MYECLPSYVQESVVEIVPRNPHAADIQTRLPCRAPIIVTKFLSAGVMVAAESRLVRVGCVPPKRKVNDSLAVNLQQKSLV